MRTDCDDFVARRVEPNRAGISRETTHRTCDRCGRLKHLRHFPLIAEENPLDERRHEQCVVCLRPALSRLKVLRRIAGNKTKKKIYDRARRNAKRAQKLSAMPSWYDDAAVREIYEIAVRISAETGIKHQVDHVIPLIHPEVCGLHVQENLEVIPAIENLRKSNSFGREAEEWRLMCWVDTQRKNPL